jgi:ABC-2 type transport system ATP-binding protein
VNSIIAIDDLSKRYGAFKAVSNLSLDVEEGSICGLLGPNGAGKTTTFKCMLGFARPSAGAIRIFGEPLHPATFERLAYVPERSVLYGWMTIAQHLELQRRSFKHYDDKRAHELLATFGLDPAKRTKRLSKGQQTAVALILAFSIRPRVLILDEPASGLDPIFQRVAIDLMIDAAANGATILFSSHQITQVERAADRIAILKNGRLILDAEVDTLKSDEKVVEAVFDHAVPALDGLSDDVRVRRLERSGRIVRAYVHAEAGEIMRLLSAYEPRSISVVDLNLEDIFLNAVEADRFSPMETV